VTPEVHIVLLHYPVLNKLGHIVSTAVTNLDLVSRMLNHWKAGFGARRVPNRVEAISLTKVDRTLNDALADIIAGRDAKPFIIATSARYAGKTTSFAEMKERMHSTPCPYVLLFGTGYGLADEVIKSSDAVLEPIGDAGDWNHLSVRSAVAIVLDRLLGDR
jgi:hypothetical protein